MREKCPSIRRYDVSLRIQSECGKIRTKNSVFRHFSRSENIRNFVTFYSIFVKVTGSRKQF